MYSRLQIIGYIIHFNDQIVGEEKKGKNNSIWKQRIFHFVLKRRLVVGIYIQTITSFKFTGTNA